jgi:hypothetical protein
MFPVGLCTADKTDVAGNIALTTHPEVPMMLPRVWITTGA